MSDSPPRGAVKEGTFGRMNTGRLVYVQRVTSYAAYLISLPEQGFISGDSWDGRFVTGSPRAVTVNPWVTIVPVALESLSPLNRQFVESGGQMVIPERPAPTRAQVKTVASTTAAAQNVNSVVKRGGEKRYEVVADQAQPSDHRAELVRSMISALGQPSLEEIVNHALKHEKFSSPSSHRAVRWFVNDLVKTGHVKQLI